MPRAISPRTCPSRATGGYSLPEMMLVVAIAGMLLAVAVPNFARFSARDRVASAAADLEAALTLARQEALARRVSYRVSVESGPTRIVIERKSGETWVADPAEPLRPHASVTLQTLIGDDAGNADLVINSQGMVLAEDAPATFTFTNDRADTSTVRMVRTGRIRARTW